MRQPINHWHGLCSFRKEKKEEEMGNAWDGEPAEGTTGEFMGFHWETKKHKFPMLGWNWNGYVDIPKGNPYFPDPDALKDEYGRLVESAFDPESLDVHGGVTYCRLSADGQTLRIGFDTAHSHDANAEPHPDYPSYPGSVFRTHAYVVEQIQGLIMQLTDPGIVLKLAED